MWNSLAHGNCRGTDAGPLAAACDPKRDLNRRTSTGNWLEDRVTWKEEMKYKKAMGYL